MDLKSEWAKFTARIKAVKDWAMVTFAFVMGVFVGTMFPMVLFIAMALGLMGGAWILIDTFVIEKRPS